MNKILKSMLFFAVAFVAALGLQSCDDDDDNYYIYNPYPRANALVTLKTNPANGQFFMQLNDSVVIVPNNLKANPFGDKEVRALVAANIGNISNIGKRDTLYADVHVLDSVRTKDMSPLVSDADKAYGTDPVEIINDWITVCEDGYLTLHFRTYFGGAARHALRLVKTDDNTITLYHDANGDYQGSVGDGIIAFRLSDLPATDGKYKEITLKWNAFSGEKSVKFKYLKK